MSTTMPLHNTHINLTEATRTEMIELLNARLADAVDLATQLKQAHWNVRGPQFIALHELFDKAVDQVREYADEIAERVGQLGGHTRGTARQAAAASTLCEYPADAVDGVTHVEAVSKALAATAAKTRAAINAAGDAGDEASADILTEVTRGLDKLLWFVEAHAQATR